MMPYNAEFNLAAHLADLRAMREAEPASESAVRWNAYLAAQQAQRMAARQAQRAGSRRPRWFLKRLFHR